MIVDEAKIRMVAGRGGDGAVSFRRERFVPKGGPDGGDGGNGGSIWFEVKDNLDTLSDFRAKQLFVAKDGRNGQAKKMHGRNGEDITIPLPPGTLVRIGQTQYDLVKVGQRIRVAKGGEGGWGNWHFATSIKQTPNWSKSGQAGESIEASLELNLIADVGLLGLPNAGKSTLLSVLSSARPIIADYPFTTTEPQLGVMKSDSHLVIADIPGLISGASQGKGMGISFLKHLRRTGKILYLIDASADQVSQQIIILKREVKQYDVEMLKKPSILVFNKIDLLDGSKLTKLQEDYPDAVFISALNKEHLDELVRRLTAKTKTGKIQ